MNQPWQILPKDFLDQVKRLVPTDQLDQVLSGFCTRRLTTFRTNTLRISTPDLRIKIQELGPASPNGGQGGIKVIEVPWYLDGFILVEPSKRELIDSEIYKQGLIYVQSLSSMIPALVLDPQPHEVICDLTAAPGSKTTQMAAMMNNTGTIIANDLSKVRLYKLQYNLKLQGVTNTKTTYLPGQDLWKKYPEYFDKVLLDSPCSLEGRFMCDDPKSYKNWTLKKVKVLAQYQKELLRSAVSLTKVGGTIVYSTCTLSKEENEEVVGWILEKEAGRVELEPINLEVPELVTGFIPNTYRVYPSKTMEGFFIAKFRKTASNIS